MVGRIPLTNPRSCSGPSNASRGWASDGAGARWTQPQARPRGSVGSLNRTAFAATWRCLTGCAIGEILGLVIATALDWGNFASIVLAVVLAFFFGYSLTLRPLVRGGVSLRQAARVALAADTVSIGVMEVVDNGFVLLVPRAMEAGLGDFLFWWSLAAGLFIAFWAAFPVNRVLIARGRGHAVAHQYH